MFALEFDGRATALGVNILIAVLGGRLIAEIESAPPFYLLVAAAIGAGAGSRSACFATGCRAPIFPSRDGGCAPGARC